jgi:hypothetical protein
VSPSCLPIHLNLLISCQPRIPTYSATIHDRTRHSCEYYVSPIITLYTVVLVYTSNIISTQSMERMHMYHSLFSFNGCLEAGVTGREL